MKISDFLGCNINCPVCNKEPSILLSINSSVLYKLYDNDCNQKYAFKRCFRPSFSSDSVDEINLSINSKSIKLDIPYKFSKFSYKILLVCNYDSISFYDHDFALDAVNACSFRASKELHLDDNICFKSDNMIIDETYAYKDDNSCYVISNDFELQITNFWYTSKNDNKPPIVLEKLGLKMLENISYENKDNLIKKFNNWILIS